MLSDPKKRDEKSPAETIPVTLAGCPTAATLTRSFESADLFGDAKTVLIKHAGEHYRMTITKNGKLILQK